ncbi:sensor histidine kinase [Lysobacter korlensis]|uniref:Sensor histidine kinase n=1 Tax=Lysobacter korlensis TaxID=553636 RepID=A0ABV6RN24_9GAMM
MVTALLLWSPYVLFGRRDPSLHLVLDSVDACVALLVAYLVHGHFLRRRLLQDLLLAQGLVLLAVAGLGSTYTVAVLGGGSAGTVEVWAPLAIRLAGAVLILGAAIVSGRVARRYTTIWLTLAAPAVGAALIVAILWFMRSGLPVALDPGYVPGSAEHAILTGHPLLLAGQALGAVCFVVASVSFTIKATRRHDELLRWLGPACALAAFARLNYVMFPSVYSDWLYTGDLLRTGFYLVLMVGAVREIGRYWAEQSKVAVLEDRRRLARELHDGVMQELAFIRAEARGLGRGAAPDRIVAASDRALDEARAAVEALGRSGDDPLGLVLHRTAGELAERHGVMLEVDVDHSVDAGTEQKHALMRITREAVSNAIRHGGASRVLVRLGRVEDARRLVVEDDGCGFDVSSARSGESGYGLTSMDDRARGLPGSFEIDATPGRGSKVTVTW